MRTLVIVLGIIAVTVGPFLFYLFNGMGRIRRLVVKDVDLSKLADGVYTGSYHMTRWIYDVQVTVKNKRIVEVKNVNQRMEKRSPRFNAKGVAAIVKAQSPRIDVVSGCTINTRSLGKAVENALVSPGVTKP
jgi:uncharacterized protein with FMN-binding domain